VILVHKRQLAGCREVIRRRLRSLYRHLHLPVLSIVARFARRTARRKLKVVPNAFGEKPALNLMFETLIRTAESWRGLGFVLPKSYLHGPTSGYAVPRTRGTRVWVAHFDKISATINKLLLGPYW
jgi:hypothetical protein